MSRGIRHSKSILLSKKTDVKVIGIRFCDVSKDAEDLVGFLRDGLGLPKTKMGKDDAPFCGAVFPAGAGDS